MDRNMIEARTIAAARYHSSSTDAPCISRYFIVFDAWTGVAPNDAHQVPTCPLRQVVSGKLANTATSSNSTVDPSLLSLFPAIDFARQTLKLSSLSTGQAYLIARPEHHYKDILHRIPAMRSPTGNLAESYSLHPYHRRFAARKIGPSEPEDP